jgi:chromosome segregation ATPase
LGFEKAKQELREKIQIEKNKYNNLEQKYLKTKNDFAETERKLHEYTSAFPGDLHNYLDIQVKFEDLEKENNLQDEEIRGMKATIRSLEQKLIYRNNVITGLRNAKRDLRVEIKDLEEQLAKARNEVLTLAKKVEFYEKQAKKTPKEKVDYLMKRGKKNENSKRNV